MTRRIISPAGSNWRFAPVSQKPFGEIDDFDEACDWLPAQVPGDVRLDLLRAGKIADPFVAANNADSQWVDARDWWYETGVDLPSLAPHERAFLVFEGIDYQSEVFWNGRRLGRHVGMFSRQVYEIPSPDFQSGHHRRLAVRIWGSDALPKLRRTVANRLWGRLVRPSFPPPSEPFPDRYATVKCQMQFGWDFAPRLRTCGIWDDASIVVTQSVLIEDVFVRSMVENQKADSVRIVASLALDSDQEQSVRLECKVRGKNFTAADQSFGFDLSLARGKRTQEISFDLRDVHFWNPWDRGDPNLYEIELDLLSRESGNAALLDQLTAPFGVRAFALDRPSNASTDAEPWTFFVNGHREFLRGANWVPLDAIPGRVTQGDYAARLKQAREANVNFLRVWGGGLREKQAFYEFCDEYGILVWQEFPFAGATLDRFPRDRAFLDLAEAECGSIVRALRNHPSLVVWCGGNEFNTRGNREVVATLAKAVEREDGTRPFKPASPYRDESHNWSVWHHHANLNDYRKDQTLFLSEFGLQSLPNTESLEKFLPREALGSPHPLWEVHHAEMRKLERYARPVIARRRREKDSHQKAESESLQLATGLLVEASQRAQAFGLQVAIEHMRRRKEAASGVAVWQFDDAWPAISWSLVDYYGTPKRGYEELKRLYSPVFASFDYALAPRATGDRVHGDLWLINDLRSSFQNAELSASLNGREIFRRLVDLGPDSAARIDALDVTLDEGENVLRLLVKWGPVTLSDHEYDLNYCDLGGMNPLGAFLYAVGKRLTK